MPPAPTLAMTMHIPHALDSDAEDVAWALQTAEALWKRNERVDAIVWLRRAAQAAGEANDDDRALSLARGAAELAEWIATNPGAGAGRSAPPPADAATASDAVDSLLHQSGAAPVDDIPVAVESTPIVTEEAPPSRPKRSPAPRRGLPPPLPPPLPPASPPPMRAMLDTPTVEMRPPSEVLENVAPATPPPPPPLPPPPQSDSSMRTAPRISAPPLEKVRSAAEAHAGMLDPWADDLPTKQEPLPPVRAPAPRAPRASPPPLPVAPPPPPPAPLPPPPPADFETEEVVTSAPPLGRPKLEKRAPKSPRPPPPPLRSPPPPPPPAALEPAPAAVLPPVAPAPPPPIVAPPVPVPPPSSRLLSKPALAPTSGVDLSGVDALSDLPDDAREAFAQAATVQALARDEEVSGFALALVLEGSVDVSATIVDAPATRLATGAVLRARGTIEHTAPLRLVGAEPRSRVATWDERHVAEAFRTCPWVEDELRAAGDRYQALVGATMGPLGERLDPDLRASVTGRLKLKALAEHEVFAARGKPIPGLLVVGAGELELVAEEGAAATGTLRAGDFLFPGEVLRAAPAPSTARAAKGGALVLFAERSVAQELLVTCPPLLEIFAG